MFFFKRDDKIIARQSISLHLGPSIIHGQGVFSTKEIGKGELIEVAPLLIGSAYEYELLSQTNLHDYYFLIDNKDTPVAIGLGFASWYNHACPANTKYRINLKKRTIEIKAIKDIQINTEITINYHGRPDDNSEIIFNSITT